MSKLNFNSMIAVVKKYKYWILGLTIVAAVLLAAAAYKFIYMDKRLGFMISDDSDDSDNDTNDTSRASDDNRDERTYQQQVQSAQPAQTTQTQPKLSSVLRDDQDVDEQLDPMIHTLGADGGWKGESPQKRPEFFSLSCCDNGSNGSNVNNIGYRLPSSINVLNRSEGLVVGLSG